MASGFPCFPLSCARLCSRWAQRNPAVHLLERMSAVSGVCSELTVVLSYESPDYYFYLVVEFGYHTTDEFPRYVLTVK